MTTIAAWLSGALPGGEQNEWKLIKEEFVIGRTAPADLVLNIPRISRQHALIKNDAEGYYVIDLQSRNGTFVNGDAIFDEPRKLKDGDQIVFAGVISLRFNNPGDTATGPKLGKLKGVWINEAAREVYVDGRHVDPPLSAAQFALLILLYQNAGNIVSRPKIIMTVWPDVDPLGVSVEAVDGLIKRLRSRLREAHPPQDYVEVIRGQGIRLMEVKE